MAKKKALDNFKWKTCNTKNFQSVWSCFRANRWPENNSGWQEVKDRESVDKERSVIEMIGMSCGSARSLRPITVTA